MLNDTSFNKSIKSTTWYKPGLKILLAVSGGVDSTVLLHLLSQVSEVEINIVHFDHQLRGSESDADRDFVESIGAKLGHEVHVVSEDIEASATEKKLSIEEAGSIRRRATFDELMKQLGYDYVASGQHADDQIESILMNLYLGSGIQGLTGTSSLNDTYIRPLLRYSREEILNYAENNHLEFCVDKSNSDISFLRNNIRANVIPALSTELDYQLRYCVDEILRAGQALNKLIDATVEDIDIEGLSSVYAPKIALGLGDLSDYFSPIQKAIFDRAFQFISSMPQGISSNHFNALKMLLKDDAIGKEIQLPGSTTACRDRERIHLFKRTDCEWSPLPIISGRTYKFPFFQVEVTSVSVKENVRDSAYFWLEQDRENILMRPSKSGDKMVVDARGRTMPVRQIMQAAKVAPHLKEYFPILEQQGEILWIPGIRTAHSALVSDAAIEANKEKHCIKVQFQKGTFE